MKHLDTFAIVACLNALPLVAQPTVQLEPVVGGLSGPVDIVHCGDDRLFIVERAGRIKLLRPDGTLATDPFLDISARVQSASGEQGLLGLAFHPQYVINGQFFVFYTAGTGNGSMRLSRFSVGTDPDKGDPSSETILWQLAKPYSNHNGGDLDFGPDGYLYFAPGDGGDAGDPGNRSQDMTVAFGKMLRIDVDNGTPFGIPPTNPYASSTTVLPAIWASGLRNPWRFGFDRQNGDLWIGDVGQAQREEVDRWPAGNNSGPNFGWRCYEGELPYNTSGCGAASSYVAPVIAHGRDPLTWCSVIGGRVYRGSAYPALQGRYLYSDYCHGRIYSLQSNGAGGWVSEEMTTSGTFGLAAIAEDAVGELYAVNTSNGNLYRIIDAAAQVRLSARVVLEGPYDADTDRMSDDLRIAGLVPSLEPYTTALGYRRSAGGGGEQVANSVLAVTGDNAVVDWVRVELRSVQRPGTVLASRQGLLQRDGDVVDVDGTSPLTFKVGAGNYHVAVRHRNHLGCMTVSSVALGATTTVVDLRADGTATWGTAARKAVGARQVLYAGNTSNDRRLSYLGAGNDRDPVLQLIGGAVPTVVGYGYHLQDVDMDGTIRYVGAANDRDPILVNVGGASPTNVRLEQVP